MQWSVSLGPTSRGFRFIADCGVPGQSIAERVEFTLARIGEVAPALGVSDATTPLRVAVRDLLDEPQAMNDSLMGLCVGAEAREQCTAALKVYVPGGA